MKIIEVSTKDLIDFEYKTVDDKGFIWSRYSSSLFELYQLLRITDAIDVIFKLIDLKNSIDTKDLKFVLSDNNIVGLYTEDEWVVGLNGEPMAINDVLNAEIVNEISFKL